jgi:hypothetical protein
MRQGRERGRVVGFTSLLAAIAVLVGATSLAQASYDPVASGATRLSFNKGFLAFLSSNGVKLVAKSPATIRGRVLTLPVSEGAVDPTIGKGEIEQDGVLVFQRGKLAVPFKRVTVKANHTPIQAKVGGSQFKVATASKVSAVRDGFGMDIRARGLELGVKVATRLNKKLHLGRAFSEGQLIGSLKAKTQPRTVALLPQDRASFAPDSGFLAKLNGLFVSVNPISPAELSPGPLFSFPIIANSQLAPDASSGTLRTGGSLEFLQLGGGQIFQHEFWVDFGAKVDSAEVDVQPSPPYPGKEGRIGALEVSMAGATVTSNPQARTIAVSNALLTLAASTAASFNEAFAERKEVFKAGDAFGALSFTASGQ